MSVLTKNEILKRLKSGTIAITPFDLNCLGPASYDLHLGSDFRVFKKIRGVLDLRNKIDYHTITKAKKVEDHLLLKPQETVLGVTKEKITLAQNICGWLEGKSSLGRLGLTVHITAGFNHPGMDAVEVLEITNLGPLTLKLRPGIAICQMIFEQCLGKAQYQGRFHQQLKP